LIGAAVGTVVERVVGAATGAVKGEEIVRRIIK